MPFAFSCHEMSKKVDPHPHVRIQDKTNSWLIRAHLREVVWDERNMLDAHFPSNR